MAERIPFSIIGGGWRAEFFLRVARARPDLFEALGVVTRNAERAQSLTERFGVAAYGSASELLASTQPLFVITSVPRQENPGLIREVVDAGLPVLSETPPAGTIEELRDLAALTAAGARIQVAEQYVFQPHHAARLAFARGGKLGRVSQAQVSACHGYHAVSLMRRLLGIGFEDARISGRSFTSSIVRGPGRNGPPPTEEIVDSGQVLITFDFGDRLGVMDFSGDQYFSPIRAQRLLVRGERGEIVDFQARWLKDHTTPVQLTFHRHEAGPNGNLEGNYLKGIQAGEDWLYHNPMAPAALTDDEIAIGQVLLKMGEYARGGKPFYSLAEACQDTYLDLKSQEAVESGREVETSRQPWATEELA